MMSGKRSFDTSSQIDHEEGSADVHFAIKVLSPVKKSKTGTQYFDGTASDGTTDLRLISFHGGLRKKLADLKEKKKPVLIKNCSIRKSRSDDKLEIFVNKNSTVPPSPKKIKCKVEKRPEVTVAEVENVMDYTQIDITAKVIKVCPARAVSTGLLQEVILVDSTGIIVLSCWESNIDKLEENSTYDFKFLTVKSYRVEKTLQFSSNTIFTPVDAVVIAESVYEETILLKQAEIIGVQNYTVHYCCINCDHN
uniref:Replication protein A OB domain-containing protein n=1 Tax=Amphimedon queenslandica TaxID=400682 RepID=A0A1X7TFV6_AMPQE